MVARQDTVCRSDRPWQVAGFRSESAMNCADYYRKLYVQAGDVLEAACRAKEFSLQAESHQFVSEIELWIEILKNRSEVSTLRRAIGEFQSGLMLVAVGHFRPAFTSLRSTLELGLAVIDHSVHLVAHREWLRGSRDVNWAALVHDQDGVLSKNLCRCFFEDLAGEGPHLNALAKTTYRLCSEYLHSNPLRDQEIPPFLEFSANAFARWHELAQNVRYLIMFVLAMRYAQDLNQAELATLELALDDNLGHLRPIKTLLMSRREP
jgi:hypothetical protein